MPSAASATRHDVELPPERIRCIFVEGAGCYGRNGADDCSSEAALIARKIGKPGTAAMDARRRARLGSEGPSRSVLDYRAEHR